MLRLFVLCIAFCFVFQGCNKLGICEDAHLSFDRLENHSNKIRFDGYYYGDFTGKNITASIYLFYENGVSYTGLGSHNMTDIENNTLIISIPEDKRISKSGWGIYKIDNNLIEFQNWTFSTGCKPILIQTGEIINDSTIKITSWKNSNSDELNIVNAIFHFNKYSSKPDSTNNFIQ